MIVHRDFFLFRTRFDYFHTRASLLTFFFCFFVLFHSCRFHAPVFGRTLMHEFHISDSHYESYLPFSDGNYKVRYIRSENRNTYALVNLCVYTKLNKTINCYIYAINLRPELRLLPTTRNFTTNIAAIFKILKCFEYWLVNENQLIDTNTLIVLNCSIINLLLPALRFFNFS